MKEPATIDGGIAGAGVPFAADTPAGEVVSGAAHVTAADEVSSADSEHHQIPARPPTFRDVEIGGGRITGYETPAGGGAERQFAMYNAGQYMSESKEAFARFKANCDLNDEEVRKALERVEALYWNEVDA